MAPGFQGWLLALLPGCHFAVLCPATTAFAQLLTIPARRAQVAVDAQGMLKVTHVMNMGVAAPMSAMPSDMLETQVSCWLVIRCCPAIRLLLCFTLA
jgi:hypothetical protein